MPINWSSIPLMALGLLAGLTFLSSLIGHTLAARNAFFGAIIAAIIFAAIYVGWNFYLQPQGFVGGVRFPG